MTPGGVPPSPPTPHPSGEQTLAPSGVPGSSFAWQRGSWWYRGRGAEPDRAPVVGSVGATPIQVGFGAGWGGPVLWDDIRRRNFWNYGTACSRRTPGAAGS